MRALRVLLAILLIAFFFETPVTKGQNQIRGKIKWERERIAPGLVWKHSHTRTFDSVPQNINILLINCRRRKITIEYNPVKNLPVSSQASEAGAMAAVNAGFFNIREGGSVTYIKTNGSITDSDTARKWKSDLNYNGSILIDDDNRFYVMPSMGNSWYDSHPEFRYVLVTGPLLVEDKKKHPLPKTSLVVNRHPRTCAGIRGHSKVILVTVDGRTEQSAGMTLDQLSSLMLLLKCRDAVNLDGGGSTTMWIKGKPYNGVVNMPCDNKRFDHEGERDVSDIIAVK